MTTQPIPVLFSANVEDVGAASLHLTLLPGRYTGHRTRWPRHATRKSRLPWLRCLHCLKRLVQIDVHDGWTCVRVGRGYSLDPIKIQCSCGTVRKFVPRSIS